MLGFAALALVAASLLVYFIVAPLVRYLVDAKGLRKYPAYAWLSPFTDFRHCYLSAQGSRSKDLYLEHTRRQAPILRIGPNSLSFCDIRAIRGIYGHNTPCIKDHNSDILAGSHRQLFDVVDKPEHSRKRKLLSAAFAIKNLEKWEFKVAYTAERLFRAFDARCTLPSKEGSVPLAADLTIDFNHWINLWTIEAINYIALSADMDMLDTGSDEVWAEKRNGEKYRARYRFSQNQAALAQAVFVWDFQLWPWVNWLIRVVPSPWKQVVLDGVPWDDVYYHQAAERLRRYQAGEKLDDFFTCLMEDKAGNPNKLEWGEIVAECSAIINAGADTTAIALTQHLWLLLQHPEHLATLRKEVDAALDPDEVIAPYDKVKDLPFLRACIDESLRLLPPTSAGLPRRTPPEGAEIMGEWIPGDTSVSMTIYSAHRDESIFPNAEVYEPARWLDPEARKRMESYFIPFSAGARACIGRNITYLEQIVVLSSLVHRYEFSLPSPDWQLPRREAFNILCGPMPIKIWRRELDE